MDVAAPSKPQVARPRGESPCSRVGAPSLRLFQQSQSRSLHSFNDAVSSIVLRPRGIVAPGSLQNFVVRRRFVFVIVRLLVVFAHRIIFELVPHQDSPQVGVPLELDSVEIENFTFLKFSTAPYRRQRWQADILSAIYSTQSDDQRAVFMSNRVKVINSFKVSGNF